MKALRKQHHHRRERAAEPHAPSASLPACRGDIWPALWRPAWWAPDGFAAIPTTALDLPLVQRLRRSPPFRVRVRKEIDTTILAPPRDGADENGQLVLLEGQQVAPAAPAVRQAEVQIGQGKAVAHPRQAEAGLVGRDRRAGGPVSRARDDYAYPL